MNPTPVAWIDSQEFYELHQAYRHASHDPVAEYDAILAYVNAKLNQARADALREAAKEADKGLSGGSWLRRMADEMEKGK